MPKKLIDDTAWGVDFGGWWSATGGSVAQESILALGLAQNRTSHRDPN